MTEQEQVEKFGLPYGDDTRYFLQVFKTKDSGDVVGKSKLKALNFGSEKQPTLLFGKEYDSLAPIPTNKAIAYDLKTGMLAPLNGIYTAPVYGGKFPEAAVYANVPTVMSFANPTEFKYNPLYGFEASGNRDYVDVFNRLNEAIADIEEYSPDKYTGAIRGVKRHVLNGGVTMAYENSIDAERDKDKQTRDTDARYERAGNKGHRLSGKMPHFLFPGKSDEDPNSQFYVVAAPKDSLVKSLNFNPDAENYAAASSNGDSDYNRTFARFITPIYKVDSRKYYSDETNSGFMSPDELLKLAELWAKNPELHDKKTKDNSVLIKFISDNLNKDPEKLRGISEKIYGCPEAGFYNLAGYFKHINDENDVNTLREGLESFKSKPFARTKLNNFLYDLYLPKIDYLAMTKDLLPATSKYTGSDRAIKNIRKEMSNSLQDFFKQGRISNACIGDRL